VVQGLVSVSVVLVIKADMKTRQKTTPGVLGLPGTPKKTRPLGF